MGKKNKQKNLTADRPDSTELIEAAEPLNEENSQVSSHGKEMQRDTDGDLHADLEAAKTEIQELKSQLKGKDVEIAALRAQLEAKSSQLKTDIAAVEDAQTIQERLRQLRQDQEEANAARDNAWKQLRAAVQEIGRLAHPDYMNSVNFAKH